MKSRHNVTEIFGNWGRLALGYLADECAQDLTEFALLLAFIVFAAAAVLTMNGSSFLGIWAATDGLLTNANIRANGS